MLKWNADKVKNLNGAEIWLFIVARVFVGFGAGALLARYYPQMVFPIAVPVMILGILFFIVAARGLNRKNTN
jgi:hypothetical protein